MEKVEIDRYFESLVEAGQPEEEADWDLLYEEYRDRNLECLYDVSDDEGLKERQKGRSFLAYWMDVGMEAFLDYMEMLREEERLLAESNNWSCGMLKAMDYRRMKREKEEEIEAMVKWYEKEHQERIA